MFSKALCFWLVIICLLGDFLLGAIHPFQYIPKKFRPISTDSWVSKFPVFFRSQQTPDVFILGSSLPMAAFSLTDPGLTSPDEEKTNENLRTTLRSEHFSSLLRTECGTQRLPVVVNLCCAGCMISDACHLLEKSVDNNVLPKVIILGIAPRDFSDNWIPPQGQTPLWQVVDDWTTKDLFATDVRSLSERLISIGKTVSEAMRIRKDLKNCLSVMFETAVRKPKEFVETCGIPPAHQQSASDPCKVVSHKNYESLILKKDLQVYANRYAPSNPKRFAAEVNSLEKLVALCEKFNITLIVIDMPLTSANLALLPPETVIAYKQVISDLKVDKRLTFIQCNQSNRFLPSDFSDSAHLNALGASKFQKFVIDSFPTDDLSHRLASAEVVKIAK